MPSSVIFNHELSTVVLPTLQETEFSLKPEQGFGTIRRQHILLGVTIVR